MRWSLIVLILLFNFYVSIAQATSTHRFITHDIAPFSYVEQGELRGFAIDIVREMMQMLDHPMTIELFPFPRGLWMAQTKSNIALFIVARNPEREHTIKWVGPLITNGVYFFKHSDNPTPMNSMDEIKQLQSIGVGRGNADHTYLTAQGFENLLANNNQLVSLQMLASKRIDATPMGELVMPEMAKQAGVNIAAIEKTDVKLYDTHLYLGFSLDVPDETIQQWQNALDRLKANGRYKELYLKYVR